MTWIAPNNFALGMITGSYGGMGFNPWSTFDWNVAGTSALVTPFFSTVQQYGARVLSGLVIIGMYWGNYYWSAYMPINSNESFDNTGMTYNVTRIWAMTDTSTKPLTRSTVHRTSPERTFSVKELGSLGTPWRYSTSPSGTGGRSRGRRRECGTHYGSAVRPSTKGSMILTRE